MMMHRDRRTAIISALPWLCLLAAMGCSRSASQPVPARPAGGSPEKPRIALIMKSLANEFFATMAAGGEKHQQAHADEYELIVNGIKDERDLSRQVGLVEEMIAQQVQAIVIAPADSKALIRVLKQAQQAGIVVVNIDNKLDEEVLHEAGIQIPFVGPDNRVGARLVGEYLAQRLQPGDEVAILEGLRTSFNGQQRRLGFEEAMQAANLKIVDSQTAQWEINVAHQISSAMLSEHARLKAILASNDNMALGALAAVKAAGKAGQLHIVGFDNIQAVQEAIRAGDILATADQHADQLAAYGIEYALEILKSRQTPQDKETPVDLITAGALP